MVAFVGNVVVSCWPWFFLEVLGLAGAAFEVKRLSYSSVAKYAECGEKWRLSRVHGLDKRTWWVTLMGSAVHRITENYDLLHDGFGGFDPELVEPSAFDRVFDELKAEALGHGVEVRASGKELKRGLGKTGGPNKKDEEWCRHYGPLMVQNWIDWRMANNYRVAALSLSGADSEPEVGVELEVGLPVGGYKFVGFVDRVFVDGAGKFVVVDLKTGNVPASSQQLRAYAAQLRKHGVDVDRAAYWMAMDGDVDQWVPTPVSGDAFVEQWVAGAGRGIEAGAFTANVGSFCKACPVREYCAAVGGERAVEVPVVEGPVCVGRGE